MRFAFKIRVSRIKNIDNDIEVALKKANVREDIVSDQREDNTKK